MIAHKLACLLIVVLITIKKSPSEEGKNIRRKKIIWLLFNVWTPGFSRIG
jgi:hypothetical protein